MWWLSELYWSACYFNGSHLAVSVHSLKLTVLFCSLLLAKSFHHRMRFLTWGETENQRPECDASSLWVRWFCRDESWPHYSVDFIESKWLCHHRYHRPNGAGRTYLLTYYNPITPNWRQDDGDLLHRDVPVPYKMILSTVKPMYRLS